MNVMFYKQALFIGLLCLVIGSGVTYMFIKSNKSEEKPTEMPTMTHSMSSTSMTMDDMVSMLKGKTGDELDNAFLTGMIEHHLGAIEMAKLIQNDAKHQELKDMANDIISVQTKEVEMMKAWQKEWEYGK